MDRASPNGSPLEVMRRLNRLGGAGLQQQQLEALDELRRQGKGQLDVLREILAQLEPVTMQSERELRNRLIEAVILARLLAEAPAIGSDRAAGHIAQLEAILRDALALGFRVKLLVPTVFTPGLVCADAVVPTTEPVADGQIARVISPAFVQEQEDGPAITLRAAHVLVYSFLQQPPQGEEVCRG